MMSFKEFISGISFRSLQPHMPPTYIDEFSNTILPDEDEQMKKMLLEICSIPKMSTLALGAIINKGIAQMEDHLAFVNVGVWNGFTFLCGLVNNTRKKCIGIDNFSEFGSPREEFLKKFSFYKSEFHHFYDMDYIDYFKQIHNSRIGFYLYDGAHDYKNQLKGLQLAEPFFAKNCIIMVDDTNFEHPRQATLDFISNSTNKYEIVLDARTYCNGHPTFWNGVMILQKLNE